METKIKTEPMTSGEVALIQRFFDREKDKDAKRIERIIEKKIAEIKRHRPKIKKDKFRYLNKNKTFIWHKAEKSGRFKIDNKYNIISGEHKGKHYKDILKWCDELLMTYKFHAGMATLEIIK